MAALAAEFPQVCYDFIVHHPQDPSWRDACVEELERLRDPRQSETRSESSFPYAQTTQDSGPHSGDVDKLLQALASGEAVEAVVEFNAAAIREDIHGQAVEQGLSALSP
jgi:hypothetical protein